MLSLASKPIAELTIQDVGNVIGQDEGQTLEFKRALSMEDGKDHPWPGSGIDDHARDELLKEIVAFANTEGGVLLLGMAQTRDAPPRAAKVIPIAKCQMLADRLRQLSESHIDPPLINVEWAGIESEENGGVVVARVSRSRNAPHRLKVTREFYTRRGENSVPMEVHEIRDLTFRSASMYDAVETRLKERRQRFKDAVGSFSSQGDNPNRLFVRQTMVPTEGFFDIDRVYQHSELFPDLESCNADIGPQQVQLVQVPGFERIRHFEPRPILRGARRIDHEAKNKRLTQEIHGDGLVEFSWDFGAKAHETCPIYPEWMTGMVFNILIMADGVRRFAARPAAEFLLEVEIAGWLQHPTVYGFADRSMRMLVERERGMLEAMSTRLPQYAFRERDQIPEIMLQVMNDIREAAGLPALSSIKLELE